MAMNHLARNAGQIKHHSLKTADMGKEFLYIINDKLQSWRSWWDKKLRRRD